MMDARAAEGAQIRIAPNRRAQVPTAAAKVARLVSDELGAHVAWRPLWSSIHYYSAGAGRDSNLAPVCAVLDSVGSFASERFAAAAHG